MRGLYDGEIRDRPHVFNIFSYLLMTGIIIFIPFFSAFKSLSGAPSGGGYINDGEDHTFRGWIMLGVGFLLLFFMIWVIGREFVFLTINKNKIIIRRPLLKFTPFGKDKTRIEIPVQSIAEIHTYTRPGRYNSQQWRLVSNDGKEILKFHFNPEFIDHTVELEDYFKENNMNIRVNRKQPIVK